MIISSPESLNKVRYHVSFRYHSHEARQYDRETRGRVAWGIVIIDLASQEIGDTQRSPIGSALSGDTILQGHHRGNAARPGLDRKKQTKQNRHPY
jgi:hypothetical protein